MQRFFVAPEVLAGKNMQDAIAILDEDLLHQIHRVLRMRKGDSCILLDGTGCEFECNVELVEPKSAIFRIVGKQKNQSEPNVFVTLFQAMPKKMELFELVLQKGTEIGVSQFVPLVTKHTEREDFPKRDRLERILKEAAEQSERGKIPTLSETISFNSAIAETPTLRILLHSRGNFPALATFLPEINSKKSCEIFIGPEGGFSEEEVESAQKNGIRIASLGNRILRTETAGVVAASIIFYSL